MIDRGKRRDKRELMKTKKLGKNKKRLRIE